MYVRRIKVFCCLGVISAVLSGIQCVGQENVGTRIGVGEAHIITAPGRAATSRNVVHTNGIRKGRPIAITRAVVHPKSERQRRQQPAFGQQMLHQRANHQFTGGENQAQQQQFLQQQQLLLQQQQSYQQQLLQQEQMQLQQQIHLHHQRLIENQVQQKLLVQHASQPQITTTANDQQAQQDSALREQAEQQAFLSRAAEQERKSYLQKKRREQERLRRIPAAGQLRLRNQKSAQRPPVRGQGFVNGPVQQDHLIGSSSQQQQNWVYQQQALAKGNVQKKPVLVVQNKRRLKKIPPQQRGRKQRLVKLIRIPKQRTKRQR